MACVFLQLSRCARTCPREACKRIALLTSVSHQSYFRERSFSHSPMNGERRKEDLRKHDREFSPTKKNLSLPVTTTEHAIADKDGDEASSEEREQTFGLLSDKYKHKFKPLGSDLVQELEEAHLGNDWVKPQVKKNTPIWYGNQMKKLIRAGKLDEAIEMLEVTMLKEARVSPTEFNFNVLIGGCGRAGYTQKAFKLYNRMKERGLEPSSVTYTSLFNACAESPWKRTDGLTRMRKLHHEIVEKSIKVNLMTHHAMMKAYAKCGELETTFRIFRHLVDSGVQLQPKTFSFLLFACAEDKQAGFLYAIVAWRQMLAQGLEPDVYIYNLLLRATRDCEIGDVETANRVLLKNVLPRKEALLLTSGVKSRSGKPRIASGKERGKAFLGKNAEKVVVEGHLRPQDFLEDRATEETHKIPPLPESHHHLVADKQVALPVRDAKSSAAAGASRNVPQVLASGSSSCLDENNNGAIAQTTITNESSPGCVIESSMRAHPSQCRPQRQLGMSRSGTLRDSPNLLDISADLSNVESFGVVSGRSHRLDLLGGARGVLERMSQSGMMPDVKTLSLLAELLPGRKQEEEDLMDYVANRDVKVDVDFYNVLIRSRTRRGDLNAAKSVLPHLKGKHLFPNLRTYVNLAAGCCRPEEGFQILKEMEEVGCDPNCFVYGALIGASQRHKNYGYLKDILKHMEGRNVTPNERVITQLEKIAAFGQKSATRSVKKKELNEFRGFYVQWLSRMNVEVPEHPWHKFKQRRSEAGDSAFLSTAI